MNLATAWRARTSGPCGTELQQAALRIVIGVLITLCVLVISGKVSPEEGVVVTVTTAYFAWAIPMFAWTWMRPTATKSRRRVAMLIDVGMITFAMFSLGIRGAFLPGVYLFVTFGNGFRYGRFDLHLCQLLCVIGSVLVGVMVPAWREHPEFFMGWLLSLLVLPFYVAALAERIKQARLKAEEELRNCLGRAGAK